MLKQLAGVDASRSPREIASPDAHKCARTRARRKKAVRRRNLGGLVREAKGMMGWKGVFMKQYAAGTFLFYWVNPGFSL